MARSVNQVKALQSQGVAGWSPRRSAPWVSTACIFTCPALAEATNIASCTKEGKNATRGMQVLKLRWLLAQSCGRETDTKRDELLSPPRWEVIGLWPCVFCMCAELSVHAADLPQSQVPHVSVVPDVLFLRFGVFFVDPSFPSALALSRSHLSLRSLLSSLLKGDSVRARSNRSKKRRRGAKTALVPRFQLVAILGISDHSRTASQITGSCKRISPTLAGWTRNASSRHHQHHDKRTSTETNSGQGKKTRRQEERMNWRELTATNLWSPSKTRRENRARCLPRLKKESAPLPECV